MRRPFAGFTVALTSALIATAAHAVGLSTNNIELWNQDSAGMSGVAESYDSFAAQLATGDFDADGYADLAIGVPLEDFVGGARDDGVVQILYGTPIGFTGRDQLWSEEIGTPTNFNEYGFSLAVGDFNGDGTDDLAVGIPFAPVNGINSAGAVETLYGLAGFGLTTNGMQRWHQDVTGIKDACGYADLFGNALSAGDFDGDGFDDLAIGIPNEDLFSTTNSGAVAILYGSATGISDADELWSQDSPDIADSCESGDSFGFSLTVGDFDGDGYDDLAVGIPQEKVNGFADAGAAAILYGSSAGIAAAGDLFLTQDAGIADAADEGDFFGLSLASGDLNGDGFDDLAIGVPYENFDGATDAGIVHVLFGAAGGVSTANDQLWSQNSTNVEGTAEEYDHFGAALTTGDFDRDGIDDLAIGAPWENTSANTAGALTILRGTSLGPTSSGSQLWHRDTPGVPGVAQDFDYFASALAAGDFNGDGTGDLAVGIPGDTVNSATDAGSLVAFFGQAGGLWDNAANLGGGWKWLSWFGYFSDQGDGWIYHNEHGWMYAVGTTTADIWFWTQDMGWLWTSDTVYPNMYRNQTHGWLWYQINSANPRWFYNYTTHQWEQH